MTAREIGAAIRELRGRRTQAQVAAAGGVAASTWSLYETGRRRPSEAALRGVLVGLGCSRLELEEAAWRFRRRQLLEEEEIARKGGDARFVDGAHRAAERLRDRAVGDPFRREARQLLGHGAILTEEVLIRAIDEVVRRVLAASFRGRN